MIPVASIVATANVVSRECPELPVLRADSPLPTLVRWLATNDPNGEYVCETTGEAWTAIAAELEL